MTDWPAFLDLVLVRIILTCRCFETTLLCYSKLALYLVCDIGKVQQCSDGVHNRVQRSTGNDCHLRLKR
jgi:hypothetical protein